MRSEARREGVAVLDFKLYHPLYAEIIPSGNQSIPFYVEPGDTLIIRVGKNGRVEAYERPDGQPVKMERLLRHDVSNRSFYTAEDFAADNPYGTFVLGFGGHVATVKDGVIYDSWDSRNEIPQYYWLRKE